jgi:putative ABC transport system ATP-binding protein
MNPVVSLDRVSKYYIRGAERVVGLERATLAISAGELVALVGPSGCGKSTTLNLIAGVDRPDEGEVRVCDVPLHSAPDSTLTRIRRECVGMVFQSFHLVPHLTVEENVALPLALAGKEDSDRVNGLIDRVGLGHRRRHYPSELSGGEQQRTAIARALVHRPAVLLADEPTGNLDSQSGETVLRLMDELRREENSALLLVTHDERISQVADRIIRMRDGRIEDGA